MSRTDRANWKTFRTLAIGVALAAAQAAGADTVVVRRVPYEQAKVTGFANGTLTFSIGPSSVRQSIQDIDLISMEGKDTFNQAEAARLSDPPKAVGLYDKAVDSAWAPWEKTLAAYRLVDALGRAGQTGRWAREWATLIADGETAATQLRPAQRGDANQVKEALAHLTGVAQRTSDTRLSLVLGEVIDWLKSDKPPATRPDVPRPPTGVDIQNRSAGTLRTIEALYHSGEAARALRELDDFLPKATTAELPRALFLAGAVRLKVAETTRDRATIAEAGLMFMRVALFYPGSEDAPSALFKAGEASELLGDKSGAATAYRLLGTQYPRSELAGQAQERWKALQAEEEKPKTEDDKAKKTG